MEKNIRVDLVVPILTTALNEIADKTCGEGEDAIRATEKVANYLGTDS